MEITAAAQWLNNFFSFIDHSVFSFCHSVAESIGSFLTPIMKVVSLTAEGGVLLIILSIIMIAVPRTRKIGICTIVGLIFGALITNVLLKPLVSRPRPYDSCEEFYNWWVFVGSSGEIDSSFPSGHVTAAAAFSIALATSAGKKWVYIPAAAYIILMAFSRNYLIVHYFSDVLAAAIIGVGCGFLSYFLVSRFFRRREEKLQD